MTAFWTIGAVIWIWVAIGVGQRFPYWITALVWPVIAMIMVGHWIGDRLKAESARQFQRGRNG